MKYILFFSILFVSVAKGQTTDSLIYSGTKTGEMYPINNTYNGGLRFYKPENYWYTIQDSATIILKCKYKSDTLYIDTAKIKHIIYLK